MAPPLQARNTSPPQFPKDRVKLNAWVRAVNRKAWTPTPHSRLCSAHFEEKYLHRQDGGSVQLLDSAVPTIFSHKKRPTDVKHTEDTAGSSSTMSTPVSDINTIRFPEGFDLNSHNYAVMASPRKLKQTIDQLREKIDSVETKLRNAKRSIRQLETKGSQLSAVIQEEERLASRRRKVSESGFFEVPMETFLKLLPPYSGKNCAIIIKLLGKEPMLGQMIKRVDETKFILDMECKTFQGKKAKPPVCFLNMLSVGGMEEERSYDSCGRSADVDLEGSPDEWVDRLQSPVLLGVNCKDEVGKINLAELAAFFAGSSSRNSEEKILKCTECGRSFFSADALKSHQRVHTREKSFICEVCGKTFTSKQNLRGHLVTHSDKKPFSCEVCGKSFSRKTHFKNHVIIHTGEKPFGCQECGKRFNVARNLARHQLVHTGEKVFSCLICPKKFTRAVSLRTHQLSHTGQKPFKCLVCEKSFRVASTLKVHQRIHTGVRPYSCEFCGKAFRQRENLNVHKRIHEKPFTCKECGKSFSQESSLVSHRCKHKKPFAAPTATRASLP